MTIQIFLLAAIGPHFNSGFGSGFILDKEAKSFYGDLISESPISLIFISNQTRCATLERVSLDPHKKRERVTYLWLRTCS
jgi:hypothetical protein